MATQTAARHGARTRRAPAPRHARRVSGPMRPLPAGPPLRRGATGAFERLRALPEHRIVDRLLRGRIWIWLIGALLGGIVAMQVSLLKLNAGISRAVTTTATLERQNAALESEIARLSSSERVRRVAAREGMVMPPAGEVEFLRARPHRDGNLAARRMEPPSDEAALVMANGGRDPNVLAAPATTDPTVLGTTVPDPAAITVPDPAAGTVADPAAATTPGPTATVPETAAAAPTDPTTAATGTTDPTAVTGG
jgi:cell division protein FtsL